MGGLTVAGNHVGRPRAWSGLVRGPVFELPRSAGPRRQSARSHGRPWSAKWPIVLGSPRRIARSSRTTWVRRARGRVRPEASRVDGVCGWSRAFRSGGDRGGALGGRVWERVPSVAARAPVVRFTDLPQGSKATLLLGREPVVILFEQGGAHPRHVRPRLAPRRYRVPPVAVRDHRNPPVLPSDRSEGPGAGQPRRSRLRFPAQERLPVRYLDDQGRVAYRPRARDLAKERRVTRVRV